MIFIDANVFLAFNNIKDSLHKKSIKLWNDIEDNKYGAYVTSDYVFNEVIGVTLRKLGKRQAVKIGNQIRNSMQIVPVDDFIFDHSWRDFEKTKSNHNLIDCSNLVTMNIFECEHIATFDKEFKKVKGIIVIDK